MSFFSLDHTFERRSEPLLPRNQFVQRMIAAMGVTIAIVGLSLAIGTAGYHFLGGLSWIDALLNSAMILTGMGPVDPMQSAAGKLFATFYALYSGIAFLSMTAVLLGPIIHRAMHTFHLDAEEVDDSDNGKANRTAKKR
jgi:hypothetical protein